MKSLRLLVVLQTHGVGSIHDYRIGGVCTQFFLHKPYIYGLRHISNGFHGGNNISIAYGFLQKASKPYNVLEADTHLVLILSAISACSIWTTRRAALGSPSPDMEGVGMDGLARAEMNSSPLRPARSLHPHKKPDLSCRVLLEKMGTRPRYLKVDLAGYET